MAFIIPRGQEKMKKDILNFDFWKVDKQIFFNEIQRIDSEY